MRVALSVALFLCLAFTVPAFAWEAEVLRVVDGDTLVVRRTANGKQEHIRLYGIDAPERASAEWKSQPYSRAAKVFLKKMLPRRSRVTVEDMGNDRYNRTVAVISLPDGKVVQERLLSSGLAWVYPQYCTREEICAPLRKLEDEARKQKRGLWADKAPVPPWAWRVGLQCF